MEQEFYGGVCEDCGKPITDDEANYEYPFILCLECFFKRERVSGLGTCNS